MSSLRSWDLMEGFWRVTLTPIADAGTKPSWTARREINLVVNTSVFIKGMVNPYPRVVKRLSFSLERVNKEVYFETIR